MPCLSGFRCHDLKEFSRKHFKADFGVLKTHPCRVVSGRVLSQTKTKQTSPISRQSWRQGQGHQGKKPRRLTLVILKLQG